MDHIEHFLREGGSDLDIARKLGIDRRTVSQRRKALGLPGYFTTADSPHCRHGHPFPENLARDKHGHLLCRACWRARARAQHIRSYTPRKPDEMAIARAVAGNPPEALTPRERQEAVLQLDAWGYTPSEIARRVGCTPRTVLRIRARRNLATAA